MALSKPLTAYGQSNVDTLTRMEVRLWPDYDRPSVLATLIGTLPSGTPFPAIITLPIPEDATINAVAPVLPDGRPGVEMSYDDSVPGQITFSTDVPGFWVEYYYPYAADGDQRDFTFSWQSPMSINELLTVVQQPIMSSDLTSDPDSVNVTTGADGMQYHQLPVKQVRSGETYVVDASYSLVRNQLSAEALAGQQDLLPNQSESTAEVESGFNPQLALAIAGGIIAVAVVIWLVVSNRRNRRRPVKPRPVRSAPGRSPAPKLSQPNSKASTGKRFCHECGQTLDQNDKFCSNCGTPVKTAG
jgi:hypothetical protein